MMMQIDVNALEREVADFECEKPIGSAWTPPSSWYTRPAFLELENERVFGRNWVYACRADQVSKPGEFATGQIAGEPYVVVRDDEGCLNAFYNVCRHHAAAIASGSGSLNCFTCPYHGWSYGLDGRLLKAPELGAVQGFSRDRFGLVRIGVEEWGPFVFLSFSPKRRSLKSRVEELDTRLHRMNIENLKYVCSRAYDVACNWKVFVDNYLDGGYHVACVHGGLAAQLDLETYRTEIFDAYSIQSTRATSGSDSADEPALDKDFSERIGDEALYAWIYPNFMINRYGPIMDVNIVLPLDEKRTRVNFDYYFEESSSSSDFIERSLVASDQVQKEDIFVCESVQNGLMSSAYDKGRYSALREEPMYHFHKLLHKDLRVPERKGS